MDKNEKYLKLYPCFAKQFNLLSDEELGKLVKAFLSYLETDEEPQDLSPLEELVFNYVINVNKKFKKGAPLGNTNAKKQIKNKCETNSKTNSKTNSDTNSDTNNIQMQNKCGLFVFKDENSANFEQNHPQNDDFEPIVDNFVDNSPKIVDNSANCLQNSALKQNYNNNFVYLVCPKEKNIIYNNARVRAREEEKRKCINFNTVLLNKKFNSVIKNNNRYFADILQQVINAMADILAEPPNRVYTAEIIHSWVNLLTDEEFCKICDSVKMHSPIRKPVIYILYAIKNIMQERGVEV